MLVGARPPSSGGGRAIGSPWCGATHSDNEPAETRFRSQVRRTPATRRSNRTILTDGFQDAQIRAGAE